MSRLLGADRRSRAALGLGYIWANDAEEEWRKEGAIGDDLECCGEVWGDEFEPSKGEHADRDSCPGLC